MKTIKSGNTFLGNRFSYGISSENDAIGQRLRDFFSAIEDQGIPDRFLDLLDKLDAAESAAAKSPDSPIVNVSHSAPKNDR